MMSQTSQQAQPSHPTLINLPQPDSNPDTPSEMPGTPTSTTTSLSALSTTAIKDGHRGHLHGQNLRGHQHNLSTNSLEAERADRISRLTGFSAVQTLRGSPATVPSPQANSASPAGFAQTINAVGPAAVPGGLTPAYFDAAGQPVAATKLSTVGTASATATDTPSGNSSSSLGGRTHANATMTAETDTETDDTADVPRDQDMANEDILSMDTNFRSSAGTELNDDGEEEEPETEMDSASGYLGGEAMDEGLASRSVAGFDDRMSDDGRDSLVGFGEGAGSTVSGPIYHRRPLPSGLATGGSSGSFAERSWGLERSGSGLSEGAMLSGGTGGGRRDVMRADVDGYGDTSANYNAVMERREAYMVDRADRAASDATRSNAAMASAAADDGMFVDTST